MILILLLPNGECHINSYQLSNGKYRTICSKTVVKETGTNTLSADNTFPGTCVTCKKHYDEMYEDDLEHAPSMARSSINNRLVNAMQYNRSGIVSTDLQYIDIEERNWWRLNKYKKLIPKAKVKPKKNKYKFLKR